MEPRCEECRKEIEDEGYCWDCRLDGFGEDDYEE